RASTPHASPVRTVAVPRIVDAAAHLRPEKVTRLRLALHPEPLGELLVELSLRGGAVHGVVQVATEAAKELVSSDLAHLRSDLERRGIRVAALEVVVSGSVMVAEMERPTALGRRLVDFWA